MKNYQDHKKSYKNLNKNYNYYNNKYIVIRYKSMQSIITANTNRKPKPTGVVVLKTIWQCHFHNTRIKRNQTLFHDPNLLKLYIREAKMNRKVKLELERILKRNTFVKVLRKHLININVLLTTKIIFNQIRHTPST